MGLTGGHFILSFSLSCSSSPHPHSVISAESRRQHLPLVAVQSLCSNRIFFSVEQGRLERGGVCGVRVKVLLLQLSGH